MAIMKLSNKIRPENLPDNLLALADGAERRYETQDNLAIVVLQDCGALPENIEDCRSYLPGQHHNLAYPGDALIRLYPWVGESLLCPWCADEIRSDGILAHPSDAHVRTGEISPDEQAEWIEEMEPEPEKEEDGAKDERRHYRRAVYFRDEDECA